MRTVPGTGAQFTPIFNSDYGVESFIVGNGGTDYDPNDPPKLKSKILMYLFTGGCIFLSLEMGKS